MRCPKCNYLSFDSSERCRNCGYDFSLVTDVPASELPIRRDGEPIGPLADLAIKHRNTPARSDFPLFEQGRHGEADDAPLITPAQPRAPLAVRRATPDPRKLRARPTGSTYVEPPLDLQPEAPRAAEEPAVEAAPGAAGTTGARSEPAGAVRRVSAGLIDVALLLIIDGIVFYFTLQVAELRLDELNLLPVAPLVGFYAMLAGGYFVTFTASVGRTAGKMAVGIQVVGENGDRVHFGQAVIRTAGYLVSALPLGLGFVPGLVGRERRALHDRLASTRVVTAT